MSQDVDTWSTPVASKLPNNCRVSRIVVIIIFFQLCILTHFLDFLKGNMLLVFFLYLGRYSGFFCQHHFILNALRGPWQRERGVVELRKSCKNMVPENYVKEPNMTLYQLMYFFPILRFTHF